MDLSHPPGATQNRGSLPGHPITRQKGESDMNNIIYVIGLVVVVIFVVNYIGR
ncbi:MAG: hypothetical protein HOP18_28555 [Deltaproteobacteria bacterium]|nr:hypothetical protein [Deltaproteobacteria bacterium]